MILHAERNLYPGINAHLTGHQSKKRHRSTESGTKKRGQPIRYTPFASGIVFLQQFVAKIVINEGTGTLYYTFPEHLYMPSYGNLDVRGGVPLSRHIHLFDIPVLQSTENRLRNLDKAQLHADSLAMRTPGMSYRQIAREVGQPWTRVQQIVTSAE
jgi:hypothetical protein